MFEELPATQQSDAEITEYVKRIKNIPSSTRAKNLKYRVVYDFVTLLFVYNEIVPEGVAKRQRHKEIQESKAARDAFAEFVLERRKSE